MHNSSHFKIHKQEVEQQIQLRFETTLMMMKSDELCKKGLGFFFQVDICSNSREILIDINKMSHCTVQSLHSQYKRKMFYKTKPTSMS